VIGVTRYFCQLKPLRTLESIRADLPAPQRETEGLPTEIIGGDAQ